MRAFLQIMLLPDDSEDQKKLDEVYEIGNQESILDNTFLNTSLNIPDRPILRESIKM